jgi:predicted N-acetyltransferase YhbS
MSSCSVTISPVQPGDQPVIESILDSAFGLGRRTKTSYRFREGEEAVDGLSFVARAVNDRIVGAISYWHLRIGSGARPALLLGPLAVEPSLQARGIGLKLMQHSIAAAKAAGHELIILVGDEPYYSRAGFARVPVGQLIFPGPVDPERLLYLELVPGSLEQCHGLVVSPRRLAAS